MLGAELDPRPLEDLGGRQPLLSITVDSAEPEEDHQGLQLLSQLPPHDEAAVLRPLAPAEQTVQVLGPPDLLRLGVALGDLLFEELLDLELGHVLPLREGAPALGGLPGHLVQPALLAPGDHGRGALEVDRLGHLKNLIKL